MGVVGKEKGGSNQGDGKREGGRDWGRWEEWGEVWGAAGDSGREEEGGQA